MKLVRLITVLAMISASLGLSFCSGSDPDSELMSKRRSNGDLLAAVDADWPSEQRLREMERYVTHRHLYAASLRLVKPCSNEWATHGIAAATPGSR